MTRHLQAIITVLSLVNPLMCAPMFTQIEAGRPRGAQMGCATKVALAVIVILTVAALKAAAVATTLMWILIVLVARLGGSDSGGFVHDAVTRFMGLNVIAMWVQFALSGVRSFMLAPYRAAVRHDVSDAPAYERAVGSCQA